MKNKMALKRKTPRHIHFGKGKNYVLSAARSRNSWELVSGAGSGSRAALSIRVREQHTIRYLVGPHLSLMSRALFMKERLLPFRSGKSNSISQATSAPQKLNNSRAVINRATLLLIIVGLCLPRPRLLNNRRQSGALGSIVPGSQ
jgi:hypothetical protein